MRIQALSLSCLLASVFFIPQSLHAESLDGFGAPPNSLTGDHDVRGISADGTVVIGDTDNAGIDIGYRWINGVYTEIPAHGVFTRVRGISGDGSVIVGQSDDGVSDDFAFKWQNGVTTYLSHLAGTSSQANGVNHDGSVVVGYSDAQAVYWTGVVPTALGFLPGGSYSEAYDVSGDGTIIVGSSESSNGIYEAFRWEGGVMQPLGDLAGGPFESEALAISADGNVIVGYGTIAGFGIEAFRWENGVMTGMGFLPGGDESMARAVNADGSIIVGYGWAGPNQHAVLSRNGQQFETISDILAAAQVDLTGWDLFDATAVDASGNIIAGNARVGGVDVAFLANLATGGVTTPADLTASLLPATQTVQQTQGAVTSGLGQSLFATTQALSAFQIDPITFSANPADISPASGFERTWSGYAVGSFGIGHHNDADNTELNGTTGLIAQVSDNLALGVGVIGSASRQDLALGGESSLKTAGGSVIAAYEGDDGLRLYGTAFAADLNVEIDRNYVNGAGIDTSHGDTDGFGYGAAVRAGWEMPVTSRASVMPYGELQATKVSLDGYTETDGAFPAAFGEQDSTRVTSRLGVQLNYDLTSQLSISTRAAWAHSLKDDSGSLSVRTTGFSGSLTGEEGDKNWAEGALSTSWQVSPGTSLQGELSGRSNKTSDPAAALTLGLKVNF